MGVEIKPHPNDPPKPLSGRKAWVQLNKLNTIVIPHDPKDNNARRWACIDCDPTTQPVPLQRNGNEVVYLVDGKETLQQFQCKIEKTGAEGDFIYLTGWYLDIDLQFPTAYPSDGSAAQMGKSMREMLTEKIKANVQVRVILDGQLHDLSTNQRAVTWLNRERPKSEGWPGPSSDSRAAGIVDKRFGTLGTHHQKILIVSSGGELTAFCGGVDINADRIQSTERGRPMHDVHCRIRGPAAWDLLKIFRERWEDHVGHLQDLIAQYGYQDTLTMYPELEDSWFITQNRKIVGDQTPVPAACGEFSVQIVRTFGRADVPYKFAPKGERSIRQLIGRAIRASQRFIYIEDQYLVDLDIAKQIKDHMGQLRHVTILVPPADLSSPAAMVDTRKAFIAKLKEGGEDKVRVFCLNKDSDTCSTYIHAKTWIFDDKFAIIGSANCNRRGMRHDSEVAAGIFDPSSDDKLRYTFAHRLRIKLWAHHLGLNTPEGHAELADGVASADNWLPGFAPDNSRVVQWEIDPGFFGTALRDAEDLGWGAIDPAGDN